MGAVTILMAAIKSALRKRVTRDGVVYKVGTSVSMVESELHTRITLPDGTRKLLSNDSLRWGCVVPGCMQKATYVAPDYWCREHWTEWSAHPGADPERYEKNAWMAADLRAVESAVTLACAVEEHNPGTAVEAGEERLLIIVKIGAAEVQVDRVDLAIECQREGCAEEIGNWHPRYWCRPHYMEWLDGDYAEEGLTSSGDSEPGWNDGPGAARPDNYPELGPREQWCIDRDLGLLDWDGPQ